MSKTTYPQKTVSNMIVSLCTVYTQYRKSVVCVYSARNLRCRVRRRYSPSSRFCFPSSKGEKEHIFENYPLANNFAPPRPSTNFLRNLSLNFFIWPWKVIPFNPKNKRYKKSGGGGSSQSPRGGDMSLHPPPSHGTLLNPTHQVWMPQFSLSTLHLLSLREKKNSLLSEIH